METIVSIKKIKGPNYELTTQSGIVFQASEDSLVKYRLLKGEEISSAQIKQIKKEAELAGAYQAVLNYLSFQLRSEKELRDYLKKKEVSSEGIYTIIEKLKDLKLVDDLVYAESYVRTQIRTSDKGPIVIRQQLIKRGIAVATIEQALQQMTPEIEFELAYQVAEKALRKYQKKSHRERINKTRQYLQTKGFIGDTISLVMEELSVEKDEDLEKELLFKAGDVYWRKQAKQEPFKRKQKVIASLLNKGFSYDVIQQYLNEKEQEALDNE
ncbi:recombination regulator RecX [Vagococcus sp.]|uniref:recombination regulator RecX n=1 Tax=Vagococcus sp. TaxID=1933889 RepID=UPI003F9A33F7